MTDQLSIGQSGITLQGNTTPTPWNLRSLYKEQLQDTCIAAVEEAQAVGVLLDGLRSGSRKQVSTVAKGSRCTAGTNVVRTIKQHQRRVPRNSFRLRYIAALHLE
jgi:hypothetical protein